MSSARKKSRKRNTVILQHHGDWSRTPSVGTKIQVCSNPIHETAQYSWSSTSTTGKTVDLEGQP